MHCMYAPSYIRCSCHDDALDWFAAESAPNNNPTPAPIAAPWPPWFDAEPMIAPVAAPNAEPATAVPAARSFAAWPAFGPPSDACAYCWHWAASC